MKPIGRIFRLSLIALLFSIAQAINALSLTKDTVYESNFPQPQNSWASWHDSVSLINRTSDTARIESIHFVVPEGKTAHLEFGFRKPYSKTGYVEGIIVRSGQPYTIFSDLDKRILPGGRLPITGFRIAECIACPVGQGGLSQNAEDTLSMLLVFDTGSAHDTLVIIGVIDGSPSTNIRNPSSRRIMLKGGGGTGGAYFPDILGRFRQIHGETF